MEPETSSISSVRTTKRKVEDAIRTLDDVVVSLSASESPTPSKRPHLSRSVYSTLSKFGMPSKERSRLSSHTTPNVDVSKSAPHLAAIIARSTSHFKQTSSFNYLSTRTVHPASEYRPSSTDSFLSRLSTYKITTYANKPPQIDAVAAARCGWMNDGKDRLVCGICDVSWVLASREGMIKDAASALLEKQRVSLVEMHKDGCPWKDRQCGPSIYRIPLQAPAAMVRDLRATALSLEPLLANVAIKHPLSPSQLSSLHSIFSVAASERCISEPNSAMEVDETIHSLMPTDTAIVVSLFGWIPASTSLRSEFRCIPSASISRVRSSTSMPPTPSLSRASSVSSHFQEQASTLIPSASSPMSISHCQRDSQSASHMGAFSDTRSPYFSNASANIPRDASLVSCVLCLRRVGLWAYSRNEASISVVQKDNAASESREAQKEFDLVKEHRSYCPYVTSSSVVPSLTHFPVIDSPGNATEGWRAVLAVVQRYELGQRQRLSRFLSRSDPGNQESSAELKGVEAMVAGVKTNGGRELLRYVKELLG